MSNVPMLRFKEFEGEWEEKKLGEIGTTNGGLTYSPNDIVESGGNLVLRSSNIQKGMISYHDNVYVDCTINEKEIVRENDILLCARNGSKNLIGKNILISKNEDGYAFGAFMAVYRSNSNQFISQFFETRIFYKQVHQHLGATINQITGKSLNSFKLFLPKTKEQQKIATFLSAVDTKIELLTKKEKLLKEYKKGVMQKIFNQEIRFKDDNGEEFPEWEKYKLIEIAKFRRGSFPQPYGLPKWYDEKNGMPFIQVYDVDNNMKLKPTTKNKISKLAQPSSVYVEKGSVILTIQGSIGRIALTQYDAYVDRTLLIFTEYLKPIEKKYFIYLIHLLFEIEKKKAPGGIIKTITKEALSSFKINLPTLEEQTKIANFLSSIDKKIDFVLQQLNQTKEFKKAGSVRNSVSV